MKQYRRSNNGTEIGRETMMRRERTAKGTALGRAGSRTMRMLRNRRGFSLAETLLAVLILLLVSMIVANGMPAATNAYNKVILGANAKTMLSTAINALHDELGTAWRVKNSADHKSLIYFNASTGAQSEISLDDSGKIQVQDYVALGAIDLVHDVDTATTVKQGNVRELVSEAGANGHPTMYATFESIYFDESTGVVKVTGLKVLKVSDNTPLASFVDKDRNDLVFEIRVISNDYID